MVDEVAWGIGWGSEGDEVSYSPECGRNTQLPDTMEDTPPRRRSTSRLPRSTSRSTSSIRTNSRSISRPAVNTTHIHANDHCPASSPRSPASPNPLTSLSNIILRSISNSSSSGSSASPLSPSNTPLESLNSPDVFSRGRHLRPHINTDTTSRSVSPLEVPPTPTDAATDRMRGRKASPRVLGDSPMRHPLLRRNSSEGRLDIVDEDLPSRGQWLMSPEATEMVFGGRTHLRSTSHDSGSRVRVAKEVQKQYVQDSQTPGARAGSMPPAPLSSPPWVRKDGPVQGSEPLLRSSPMPIVASKATRSRSVGFDSMA